jgi:hypothetical protein
MAAIVGGSFQPKYTRILFQWSKGRTDAYDRWKQEVEDQKCSEFRDLRKARHALAQTPIPEEVLPRQFVLEKGKKLYDWVDAGGTGLNVRIVSQKLKDLIESLTADKHQFVPIEILHKDGTPYGAPYYLFKCLAMLDAINPELGGFNRNDSPSTPDAYTYSVNGDNMDKLAVYKDRIAGHAIWHDTRMGGDQYNLLF